MVQVFLVCYILQKQRNIYKMWLLVWKYFNWGDRTQKLTGSQAANTETYRTGGFQDEVDGKSSREKNQIEENTMSKGGEGGRNSKTGLGGEMGIAGYGWESFVQFHKSLQTFLSLHRHSNIYMHTYIPMDTLIERDGGEEEGQNFKKPLLNYNLECKTTIWHAPWDSVCHLCNNKYMS